jgi:uncharacterized protein YeaO (DUF488 family)
MSVSLKRVYEKPTRNDGYRVLVDGIWPRGISKDEARVDEWKKEIAPSGRLRKSLHSGSMSWGDFRREYLTELKSHRDEMRKLADRAKRSRVTLLFGAKDEEHNNAVVAKQYLKMLGAK